MTRAYAAFPWVVGALALALAGCEEPAASVPDVVSEPAALSAPRPPLRLIAPLSGAIVGSRRPLLRWDGPDFSLGVVCRDRDCRRIVSVFLGNNHSAQPLLPLPTGPLFWRVIDRNGRWSQPWELFVLGTPGSAPRAVLGFHYDVNADGFVDAAVRTLAPPAVPGPFDSRTHLYQSGPNGIDPTRETIVDDQGSAFPVVVGDLNGDGLGELFYSGSAFGIGDFNGDGYGDVLSGAGNFSSIFSVALGSATGLASSVTFDLSTDDPSIVTYPFAAGDLNGDGYGDAVLLRRNTMTNELWLGLGRGGPDGLLAGTLPTFAPLADYPQAAGTGDLNGDGFGDLVMSTYGTARVYFGGPSGLPATPSQELTLFTEDGVARTLAIGDFNRDGIQDVAAAIGVGTDILFFDDERIDIHFGSRSGLQAAVAQSLVETDYFPDNHNRFGVISTTAGDFDADGFDNLLVGASTVFPPPPPDGFPQGPSDALVFRGGPTGVSSQLAQRLVGEPGYGASVAASTPSWVLY